MNMKPLADRVVLKRVEEEEKTRGGIIIPDTAKDKPLEAQVMAVGPGKMDKKGQVRPLDVKVGDRVIIGKWSGTEVTLDGIEHVIVREDDILAVVAR